MLRESQNDSPFPVASEVDPNVEDDTHGLFKGGLLSSPPRESSPDSEDSRTLFSSSSMQDDDDRSASSGTLLSRSASPGSPSLSKCDDLPQDDECTEQVVQLYRTVVPPSVGWVPKKYRLAKSTSQSSCLV